MTLTAVREDRSFSDGSPYVTLLPFDQIRHGSGVYGSDTPLHSAQMRRAVCQRQLSFCSPALPVLLLPRFW